MFSLVLLPDSHLSLMVGVFYLKAGAWSNILENPNEGSICCTNPKEHKHLAQSPNVLMGIRAVSEVRVIQ